MPVSSELVEILVCPETKQPVAIASQDVLARVNDKISAGSLRNRGGEKVEKAITEGLLREDGKAAADFLLACLPLDLQLPLKKPAP